MQLLSQFYMDKIISLGKDKLILKELPYDRRGDDVIKIEQELFSWRLYHGHKYIQCASEAEAEYLKIFMEARLSSVAIPKDEKYLKKVLPELKELKRKHDDIIEDHIDTLFSRKLRDQALSQIWSDIFGDEYFNWEALEPLEKLGE